MPAMGVASGADHPPGKSPGDPIDRQQNQNKKTVPGASAGLTHDEYDYL